MAGFTFASRRSDAGRMIGALFGRPLVGPRAVSLEVTHHCNLRCIFCESHGSLLRAPITSRREYAGGRTSMDLPTVRRLAGELAGEGVDLVQLSGKGDPIAHPQMTEIVRVIKDAGLGCALVTNATLASPDLASELVEAKLDRLTVSINAGSGGVYSRITGSNLFDRAVKVVRDVMGCRHAAGMQRPWVRVSHIVCRENMDDFGNMAELSLELGVDEVIWDVMGELPETAHLSLSRDDAARLQERAFPWKARLDMSGVMHNLPHFISQVVSRAGRAGVQTNPLQRLIPCYEGWFFCVVAPDGAVLPCCYCEAEILGNIHEQSFRKIWLGKSYANYRKESLDMPGSGRPVCPECFMSCNKASQNLHVFRRTHPHRRKVGL